MRNYLLSPLASRNTPRALGWDPGSIERAFVVRTVSSGEGGLFSRDRIWILLAMDGELAPAPSTCKCVRRRAGYPVGSTGFAVTEHLALVGHHNAHRERLAWKRLKKWDSSFLVFVAGRKWLDGMRRRHAAKECDSRAQNGVAGAYSTLLRKPKWKSQ